MSETLHSQSESEGSLAESQQLSLVDAPPQPPPLAPKAEEAGRAGRLTLVGRGGTLGLGLLLLAYGVAYLIDPAWQLLALMGLSAVGMLLFRLCVYLAARDSMTAGAYLGMLNVLVLFTGVNLLLADSAAPVVVGVILGITIFVYVLGAEHTLPLILFGSLVALANLILSWQAVESLPRVELSSGLGLALNLVMLGLNTITVSLLIAFTVRDFQMTLRRARRYADELIDTQSALEKQVLERTQELSEANERLLETNFQRQQAQQETEDALEKLADANEENRRALAQLRQMNEALKTVTQRSQWRLSQIEGVAEIGKAITPILDWQELLDRAVELIRSHFESNGVHHVSIFMPDEVGQNLVVQASTGHMGKRMLELRHHFGKGDQSLIGWVAANRQSRVASGDEAARLADQLSLPGLKKTQTQIAVPLLAKDELIGVLNVHSRLGPEDSVQVTRGGEEVAVFQAIADHLAAAIENARQFAESENRLAAIEEAQRQYVGHVWEEYLETKSILGFQYNLRDIGPAAGELPQEAQTAVKSGETVVIPKRDGSSQPAPQEEADTKALVVPIKVRGAVIGALGLQHQETPDGAAQSWRQEDIELLETVGREVGLALETARLLEETQRRARREQFTRQITDKIRGAGDIDGILQTTIKELSRTLRVPRVAVQLTTPAVSEQEEE